MVDQPHNLKITFPSLVHDGQHASKSIDFDVVPVTENVLYIKSKKGSVVLTQLTTELGELFYPGQTLTAGSLKIGGHIYNSEDGENYLLSSAKCFTYYFNDVIHMLRAFKLKHSLRYADLVFLFKFCYSHENRMKLFEEIYNSNTVDIATIDAFRTNLSPVNYVIAESSKKCCKVRISPDFYIFAGEVIGFLLSKLSFQEIMNFYDSLTRADTTLILITYGIYKQLTARGYEMTPEHILEENLIVSKPQIDKQNFFSTLSVRKDITNFLNDLKTLPKNNSINNTESFNYLLKYIEDTFKERPHPVRISSPRSVLSSAESDFLRHYNLLNSTLDSDSRLDQFLGAQDVIFNEIITFSLSSENWQLLSSFTTNRPDILSSTSMFLIFSRWSYFLETNFPVQTRLCPYCSCPEVTSNHFSCFCIKFKELVNHSEFSRIDNEISSTLAMLMTSSYLLRLTLLICESLNLIECNKKGADLASFSANLFYDRFYTHKLIVNDTLRVLFVEFVKHILETAKNNSNPEYSLKFEPHYAERSIPMYLKLLHLYDHPEVHLEPEKKWFYVENFEAKSKLERITKAKNIPPDRIEYLKNT